MTWKSKTTIREIASGKPFMVLHSYINSTLAVDLTNNQSPAIPVIILERDYDKYIDEKKLSAKEKKRSWYDEPKITWTIVGLL